MSPERVDKRIDTLEAQTHKRIEALTERILSLEKEQARLEGLLDVLRGASSRRTSRLALRTKPRDLLDHPHLWTISEAGTLAVRRRRPQLSDSIRP